MSAGNPRVVPRATARDHPSGVSGLSGYRTLCRTRVLGSAVAAGDRDARGLVRWKTHMHKQLGRSALLTPGRPVHKVIAVGVAVQGMAERAQRAENRPSSNGLGAPVGAGGRTRRSA